MTLRHRERIEKREGVLRLKDHIRRDLLPQNLSKNVVVVIRCVSHCVLNVTGTEWCGKGEQNKNNNSDIIISTPKDELFTFPPPQSPSNYPTPHEHQARQAAQKVSESGGDDGFDF